MKTFLSIIIVETQTAQNNTYHNTILIVFLLSSVVYACVCVISQSLWIRRKKEHYSVCTFENVCVMARGTVSVEIC